MNEIAMNSAIAVLEGVHINEPERQHRGGDHRVEICAGPLSKAVMPSSNARSSSGRALT